MLDKKDPRKAKTLEEACLNPDGKTYNGIKMLSWLSAALDPKGKGLSEAEVKEEWEKVKAKKIKESEGKI